MSTAARLSALTLFLCSIACSRPAPAEDAAFPDRPVAQTLEGGVQFHDIRITGRTSGRTARLWVYLPPGVHARASLPAVLIAPAGSNLVTGKSLSDGDRPEHTPYVWAGLAVVGYELDGDMPPARTGAAVGLAIKAYMASKGGILDALTALDYVIAKVPEIDPGRIYTAGHSSAAVVALVVTAVEPRVKAGAAYAPVIELADQIGAKNMQEMNAAFPGMSEFVRWASPSEHVAELCRKPVLLFSATDDARAPHEAVVAFGAELSRRGCPVTIRNAATGGHYDSMLQEGIPAGIEWLRALDSRAGR